MPKPIQLPEQVLDHSTILAVVATQQALEAITTSQTFTVPSDHSGNVGPSKLFSQKILATNIASQASSLETSGEVSTREHIDMAAGHDNASEQLDDHPVLETSDSEHPFLNDSTSEPSKQRLQKLDQSETTSTNLDQESLSGEATKTSFFAGLESLRSQLADKEKYFDELQHKIEELTSDTHNAKDKYEQAKADPRTSTERLIFLKEEADRSQRDLDDTHAISQTVADEVQQSISSLEEYERANPNLQDGSPQTVSSQRTAATDLPPEQATVSSAQFFQSELAEQNLRETQKELAQKIQDGADPEKIKGLVKEIEKQKGEVEQIRKAVRNLELKETTAEEQAERKEKIEQLEKADLEDRQSAELETEEGHQKQKEDHKKAQSNEQETQKEAEEKRLKEKTELETKQKTEEDKRRVQQEAEKEAARRAEAAEQERLKAAQQEDNSDTLDALGRGVLWATTVPVLAQVALFTLSVPAAAAAMLMHTALTADQQTNQRRRNWW